MTFDGKENFCLWDPKSWALESVIQLKKSGIPPTITIRNPSSTDKESEIHSVLSRIQDFLDYLTWDDISVKCISGGDSDPGNKGRFNFRFLNKAQKGKEHGPAGCISPS